MNQWLQTPLLATIICTFLVWSIWQGSACNADYISLKMVYKFSAEAHEFRSRKYNEYLPPLPAKGTREYHKMLRTNDRVRHDRNLITYDTLYFSAGNETIDYGEKLGWLHYAVIDLGTPNTSFLVALDTGSDLLWVPCECKQCAPTSASTYELDKPLNIYSPAASKTSKQVTCGSDLCDSGKMCKSKSGDCPYSVQYLSDNTSTSGILIEDVVHLASGNHLGGSVETPVVFGCGQVQSGGFLNGGAPDGLLGLGLGSLAIPSILAKSGLVSNSFSMCFQPDNSGRIVFGDKGPTSQQTTPFLRVNGTNALYAVSVDKIQVGSTNLDFRGLEILVDSGTSFTYLPFKAYSMVTTEFDLQINKDRAHLDVPWDFCYEVSDNNVPNYIQIPTLSIVLNGGGNFTVYSPLIGLYENGTINAFCLGILAGEVAILGQNFMLSYRLVFDREELKLGWYPSDCYKFEETKALDAVAPSTTLSPLKAIPSLEAPSGNSPAPIHAAPPRTSPGVQGLSNGDSTTGCRSKPFSLYRILSVFIVIPVLCLRLFVSW